MQTISLFQKLKILVRSISLVYKENLFFALSRDAIFLIITAIEIYEIQLGGQFIDQTAKILANWKDFSYADYFYTDSFRSIILLIILYIVATSLSNLRSFLRDSIEKKYYLSTDYKVLEKISKANLQEVETSEYQSLLALASNYSISRVFVLYDAFSEVVRNIIRTFSAMVILLENVGLLSLVLIIFAIPEAVSDFLGNRKIRKITEKSIEQERLINYVYMTFKTVPNFAEMRVDNIFQYFRNIYKVERSNYDKATLECKKHFYIDKSFYSMIGQLLEKAFAIALIPLAIIKKWSIGHFKANFDYAWMSYASAFQAFSGIFAILDHISYSEKLFSFLDYKGFGDSIPGTIELTKKCPSIEFLNLDFGYPGRKNKVLENISFSIKPGEKVAFVGVDGSGKTSLARLLCGLYQITAGDYMVDGNSIRELARGELKSRISVIFQNFIRYDFTIKRNITLGDEKKKISRSLLNRVLDITGVKNFMDKEGMNENTRLGKTFSGGCEISPGFWQRIAIARMLYRNKQIFIMDEPFTYIDGESRENILKGIIDFVGEEKILIYITQDTDHLELFDKIYYLKGGKIVEAGDYKALVKNKGLFYKQMKFDN